MGRPFFNLNDLRGGINDADSPFAIGDTQVVEAKDVDFRSGMLGAKRGGMSPLALTNSIFSRDLPQLQNTNKGGFTGAAGGSVTLTAGANVDGTGATNHMLIVRIVTKAATAVTALDLNGTNFVGLGAVTNGTAGRLSVFYLIAPALASTTLNITLAGAADCAVIAERWIYCDPVAPSNFTFTSGVVPLLGVSATTAGVNAQYMGQAAFAVGWPQSVASFPAQNPGIIIFDIQTQNNNPQVITEAVVGMKPSTRFFFYVSVPVDYILFTWTLRGRTFSAATSPTRIAALMRHQPNNSLTSDELWAQDNFGRLDRYVGGAWQTGVPCANAAVGSIQNTAGNWTTNAVSLHGKFFLALDGLGQTAGVPYDRLHIWDGAVLRWAGLSNALGVSAANRAGIGTFTGTRYYRARATNGASPVSVRSEPSFATITFAPSGVNTGATITLLGGVRDFSGFEGETNWELEASTDNTLFYRISTLSLGTTTFDDTTVYNGAATYTAFPLSENIGEYVYTYAPRHLAVDQDRLLMGGSVLSPVLDSRVQWTPLRADNGTGNDERVPITNRFFTDLDALRGGNLTYMSGGMSGAVYATKLQQVHKLVRTGNATKAYDTHIESEERGCLMRGGCMGIDEEGLPAVYFTDSNVGLCRFGVRGLEDLSQQRRTYMQQINKAATVVTRVLFYPKHWLVWMALAPTGQSFPTKLACYNVRTKSWTDYTGSMATMLAGVLFPNSVKELRPMVAPNVLGTSVICEADSGVNDDGVRFRGYLVSKPYQLGNLYARFGIAGAALMARAGAFTMGLSLVRNYGLEQKDTETKSFAASVGETSVVNGFDDAEMSQCNVVQFIFGDPVAFAGAQLDQTWVLDEVSAKYRLEDETTGS